MTFLMVLYFVSLSIMLIIIWVHMVLWIGGEVNLFIHFGDFGCKPCLARHGFPSEGVICRTMSIRFYMCFCSQTLGTRCGSYLSMMMIWGMMIYKNFKQSSGLGVSMVCVPTRYLLNMTNWKWDNNVEIVENKVSTFISGLKSPFDVVVILLLSFCLG